MTNFQATFRNCISLTGSIPTGLFANNSLVTDFGRTFQNCPGITSALPTLWLSNPFAIHDNTFTGCIQAINFQDAIEAGWATNITP